ncbi:MAG: DNA polymerase III subunit beta [Kiritimatiellia bacterium]|jgi:DNA polymerase-3 subunit beta
MKFTVAKDAFLKGLQMIQSIISSHNTTAILYNVLLTAESGKLKMAATDLSVSLQYSIDGVDVSKPGATTLHARRLFGLVRELPGDRIEVSVDDKHTAVIQAESSNYKIYGIMPDEFPPIRVGETENVFSLEQGAFREMLKKTVYAVSTDESRRILNGILLNVSEQKLTVVATDGRRLALVDQEIEISVDVKVNVVIPTKTVNELIKALGDEGTLKIKTVTDMVSFEIDNVVIVSKLIDGNYPNYRQVIPGQCEERITLERETLLATLRRVSQLTNEKNIPVRFTFDNNRLRVFASVPDVGEADETMPIKYKGKKIDMAFNPDYMMDPLRNLTSDEINIEMVDDLSPAVIKCDIPFLYVIMPLRLS